MIMSSLTMTTLILTTMMLYATSSASPSAVSVDVDRELQYHNGTLLTGKAISINIIWYGSWRTHQKETITEFINSISGSKHQHSSDTSSVSDWWQTVRLYTDHAGTNISNTVAAGTQITDSYSHGKNLTRTSIESVINSNSFKPLPLPNSFLYLLLTSEDVDVVGVFCQVNCGYNYFTNLLPYAWVGNSGKLCPGLCAFPFAVPDFLAGVKPLVPPNGDVGLDGMIGEIAQEIVAVVTNPFNEGWYIGNSTNPMTINHLCKGFFGNHADGSYPGQVLKDLRGASYNVDGIKRKFMVPWIWNYVEKSCTGRLKS